MTLDFEKFNHERYREHSNGTIPHLNYIVASLPDGLEVRCWPNKPVVVGSSLGSGETVSVSSASPAIVLYT